MHANLPVSIACIIRIRLATGTAVAPPPRANRTAPLHFIFTPTNFHPSDPQIHSGVSSLSSLDLRDFAHAVRCPAAPAAVAAHRRGRRSPGLSQTRVFAFSGSGPRPGSEERMRNRRGGRRPPGWVCTRTDRVRRNVHIKRAASADRTESRRERESRRPVISWILAMTPDLWNPQTPVICIPLRAIASPQRSSYFQGNQPFGPQNPKKISRARRARGA